MKYDDASWHYGGVFPDDLPPEAGATHIGMFVAWAILNGLGSDEHDLADGGIGEELVARRITPGQWFIQACDEKFVDDDLSEAGNAFAASYFGGPQNANPLYLDDYEAEFGDLDRIYYVEDNWENFDRLARRIDSRYADWINPKVDEQAPKRPFWKRFF